MFNKKVILIVLSVALSASAFSGCGSESDEGAVIDFEIDEIELDTSDIEPAEAGDATIEFDPDVSIDVEPVESLEVNPNAIDFDIEVPSLDIEPVEPVEVNPNAIDFNIEVPQLDIEPVEPLIVPDIQIEFDIPDLELDFSEIQEYKVVQYVPEFNVSHPELDFSDVDIYEEDDSDVIKGVKTSLADNVYADDYETINEMDEEELVALTEMKFAFLKDLRAAFTSAGLNVNVNEISGEVTLNSAILFGFDKSDVTSEGKEFLKKFASAYASVVTDVKYDGFIKNILVEGHTDANGEYDYNLKLSQERADNVAEYCLSDEIGITAETGAKLRNVIKAIGFASNDLIYKADGTVDNDASRRVSFRFIVNVK